MVIVANGYGCTQGPFSLPWRLVLVGQGSRIEAIQNLPNVRFLSPSFAHASAKTLIQQKFGNIVRVETSRYLTKIMTLRKKADRKQRRSLRLLCTAGGNQMKLKCIEFETYGGGLEAGHAHGCSLDSSQTF